MFNCGEEVYKTPFGDLKDDDLLNAESLYYFFYDMVNDDTKNDYVEARNLYAHPKKYMDEFLSAENSKRADEIYSNDQPLLKKSVNFNKKKAKK